MQIVVVLPRRVRFLRPGLYNPFAFRLAPGIAGALFGLGRRQMAVAQRLMGGARRLGAGLPEEVSQNQQVVEAYLGDPEMAAKLAEEERDGSA